MGGTTEPDSLVTPPRHAEITRIFPILQEKADCRDADSPPRNAPAEPKACLRSGNDNTPVTNSAQMHCGVGLRNNHVLDPGRVFSLTRVFS